MTAVSAQPLAHQPYPQEKTRRANGDQPGHGHSFGHTLLALLGQALALPDGEIGALSGGMRSTAEMFNEHGFFDDTPPGIAATNDACAALAPIIQPPIGSPAALSGNGLSALVASERAGMPVQQLPSHRTGHDDLHAGVIGRASGSRSTAPARAVAHSLVTRISTEATEENETTPAPGASRRTTAQQATARLKVTLDYSDTGVAVSVTTDADAAADHEDMREAVSQMLARHGLVLSELRVNRRPDSDQRRG